MRTFDIWWTIEGEDFNAFVQAELRGEALRKVKQVAPRARIHSVVEIRATGEELADALLSENEQAALAAGEVVIYDSGT